MNGTETIFYVHRLTGGKREAKKERNENLTQSFTFFQFVNVSRGGNFAGQVTRTLPVPSRGCHQWQRQAKCRESIRAPAVELVPGPQEIDYRADFLGIEPGVDKLEQR